MREPPVGLDDTDVLDVVRRHWARSADAVSHLPLGFGAHHWVASEAGRPLLFVTLDAVGATHDLDSLGATYAAAGALAAAGLDFVHAGLEPWVVPLGAGALSVTPWLDGTRPEALDATVTGSMLGRLHAADPPAGLRRWRPLVGPGLADDLTERVRRPWDAGPLGEQAREAIAVRLDTIGTWVTTYHRHARDAPDQPWVVTHGEPGVHNQLLTVDGPRLVDWESLLLAPAERDLRAVAVGDASMLEMFDLEWRLDEVSQYADWFEAPHTGTADDEVALAGLLEELAG